MEPPEIKVEDFTADNMPKGKDQWNALKEADPAKWGELTQSNIDRLTRSDREAKEKITGLESQRSNLTVELERYKTTQPIETPIETPVETPIEEGVKKTYSTHNLPKTQQEWEDLGIDNPTLHADLRYTYNSRINANEGSFNEAQAASRRAVQAEHPDMYLAELDESGQPKQDDQGKVILVRDKQVGSPTYGEAVFNPSSEKGKLWDEIFNKNPNIASNPQAAELMMASMERQLRVKGEQVVEEAKENREQQIQDGQVVQEGVQPPEKKVDVTFKSDEEKRHAQNAVDRGTYTTLEEYVKYRDSKEDIEGIYETDSSPVFTKK